MQENGPSRLTDFLISGAIAGVLSPIVIILISEGSGPEPNYPDDTSYFYIGPMFIFFGLLFAIIGTIIFFTISLVIRAVQGPKNHSTSHTYNPPNYQIPYQQPQNSPNKLDKYGALEKLDELNDKGIISDEEFQAEKDKILNP
jgi:uncharacterized membrane protein